MNHPSTADPDAPAVTTPQPATLVRRAIVASARELDVALRSVASDDRRRQKALDRWFAGFAAQVRNHLELLDSMVVPTLAHRRALDDRALERLADDHSYVDELLSDLGDALGVLSFGLGAESWWIGKASDLAAALAHVLDRQLTREDELLVPLVMTFLDDDERAIVDEATLRAVATGPVRFSLAWLYAHITADEQATLAAHVPATSRFAWRTRRHVYTRSSVAALG